MGGKNISSGNPLISMGQGARGGEGLCAYIKQHY